MQNQSTPGGIPTDSLVNAHHILFLHSQGEQGIPPGLLAQAQQIMMMHYQGKPGNESQVRTPMAQKNSIIQNSPNHIPASPMPQVNERPIIQQNPAGHNAEAQSPAAQNNKVQPTPAQVQAHHQMQARYIEEETALPENREKVALYLAQAEREFQKNMEENPQEARNIMNWRRQVIAARLLQARTIRLEMQRSEAQALEREANEIEALEKQEAEKRKMEEEEPNAELQ